MKGWNKEKIETRIKDLAGKLGKTPRTKDWDAPGLPSSANICLFLKTSWNQLLKDCGLEPNIEYGEWTPQNLVEKFLRLLREKAIPPLIKAFNSHPELPSSGVVNSLFGSWGNFLKACGSEAITAHLLWYQWQYVCEEIAVFLYGKKILIQSAKGKIKGRPDIIVPNNKLIIDAMTSPYVCSQKTKEIKNYSKGHKVELWCLFPFGKKYPGVTYRYATELKQIINLPIILKKTIDELENKFNSETLKDSLFQKLKIVLSDPYTRPKIRDFPKFGLKSVGVYERVFSLKFVEILKLLNLSLRKAPLKKFSNDALITDLKCLYFKKKVPLNDRIIRKFSTHDKRTFSTHFGGLEQACIQAGVPFNRLRRVGRNPVSTKDWPYERVLARIMELQKHFDRRPTAHEWNSPDVPDINAILVKFGVKWNKLIEDSGMKPNIRMLKARKEFYCESIL